MPSKKEWSAVAWWVCSPWVSWVPARQFRETKVLVTPNGPSVHRIPISNWLPILNSRCLSENHTSCVFTVTQDAASLVCWWDWCNLHSEGFKILYLEVQVLLAESRFLKPDLLFLSETWLLNEQSLLSHQCWLCHHQLCYNLWQQRRTGWLWQKWIWEDIKKKKI